MLLKLIKVRYCGEFLHIAHFGFPSLKFKVPIFEYPTLNLGPVIPIFDQRWLHNVMTRGQNLKCWKNDFMFGFLTLKLVIAQLHCG